MKQFLLIICLLFINNAAATEQILDFKKYYTENLSNKPTGVYQSDDTLFFVVKQACLSNKKYSGTKESKKSRLIYFQQLTNEVSKRSVVFANDALPYKNGLSAEIKAQISKELNSASWLQTNLLFDRDNKKCEREFVYIAPAKQFEKHRLVISKSRLLEIIAKRINKAIKAKNYIEISEYLGSLNLNELKSNYDELSINTFYPVAINYGDAVPQATVTCNMKSLEGKYCKNKMIDFSSLPNPFHERYDFFNVMKLNLEFSGKIKIESLNPNRDSAVYYLNKAKDNFSLGANPQQIINDLTRTVNFQPNTKEAWAMFSSLFRATNEYTHSVVAANQYVIVAPSSIEPWVYLMKALENIDKQQADTLHQLINEIKKYAELSTWAQKQMEMY